MCWVTLKECKFIVLTMALLFLFVGFWSVSGVGRRFPEWRRRRQQQRDNARAMRQWAVVKAQFRKGGYSDSDDGTVREQSKDV